MANLNFFQTYVLASILEEQVPAVGFFKDRYFPTGAADIFRADKVLTEYRDGDRKMAAFVSPRVGDIAIDRTGYSIHEYQPAYIGISRILSLDDLQKRGFGEAIYATVSEQERASRIIAKDLVDLESRITRREEWMAVQTMIENGCTMQEYIDAKTEGEELVVKYYDGATSDHTYTVSAKWGTGHNAYDDVKAMARKLSTRGLPAADLVLGSDAYEAFLEDEKVKDMIDKRIGFNDAIVGEELTKYDGVTYIGTFNFGGFRLAAFVADETYVDNHNATQSYFPAKSAMVTAPACGHMMYGQVTQIDYGATDFTSYAQSRVPKVFIDQDKDLRKIRLASRPLAAPLQKSPYVYAADVVA